MTIPTDNSPFDKSPDRIAPAKAIETTLPEKAPGSSFQSYMQSSPTPPGAASATGAPSPLSLPQQGVVQGGTPTFNTLLGQAQATRDTLGTVEQQLNTPNLKFKRSQSHLIRNKLTDANDYLRSATDKLGADSPEPRSSAGMSMLGKLLAYVGTGQDQLNVIQQQLHKLSSSGASVNGPDMLVLQIKLSQAQQEVEYSATLVNKMIDSLKTLFSVQL